MSFSISVQTRGMCRNCPARYGRNRAIGGINLGHQNLNGPPWDTTWRPFSRLEATSPTLAWLMPARLLTCRPPMTHSLYIHEAGSDHAGAVDPIQGSVHALGGVSERRGFTTISPQSKTTSGRTKEPGYARIERTERTIAPNPVSPQ